MLAITRTVYYELTVIELTIFLLHFAGSPVGLHVSI
jgi:hypothetical protein